MALRHNHYEVAFEALLRRRRLPYVAVDERRRSLIGDRSLKNADFLVSGAGGRRWVIDVKGRRFGAASPPVDGVPPSRSRRAENTSPRSRRAENTSPRSRRAGGLWKNWCTGDDLAGLAAWEEMFGEPFRGLLVFAYHVLGRQAPVAEEALLTCSGRRYAFVAVPADEYRSLARPLSMRWGTFAMRAADFRAWAAPVEHFLGSADPQALTTGVSGGDAGEVGSAGGRESELSRTPSPAVADPSPEPIYWNQFG